MKKPEGSRLLEIKKAAQILKNGGVVIFPTDTVYGIGCIYNNKEGLTRIYKIKNRPRKVPFPVLLSSVEQAGRVVEINKTAKKLMKKYWPGGLTIVLNSIDEKTKLGVRMPNSEITLSLIEESGSPIIGTSANFHGQKPVADFKSLDPKLTKLVDFVVEGNCQKGQESTVIDTTGEKIRIIRQGAVKLPINN